MTSKSAQHRVLIIGKSQLVLDGTTDGLRELGYAADATNEFGDLTGQFDLRQLDVVVLGGQVPPDRKAELMHEISSVNPPVIFVQGLAGIPGLIVQQVRAAFSGESEDPGSTASYDPAKRAIKLTLAHPADVKVTAWWQTSFVPPDPESDARVLLDAGLDVGDHAVPVPEEIPDRAAFAAVEVDHTIQTFAITTTPSGQAASAAETTPPSSSATS
jgi:hypothetical protein